MQTHLAVAAILLTTTALARPSAPAARPDLNQVVITHVTVQPRVLRPGARLRITFHVRNRAASAALTQSPPPGTTYEQGSGWRARGFEPVPGRFRVGVSLSGARGRQRLYRWGFGSPLRPLEYRTITGYLRIREPGAYTLYPAMIREGVGERPARSIGLVRVGSRRGPYRTVAARIVVDGRSVATDVPPKLIGATIMVPIRFIAEGLGASVDWQPQRKRVVIRRAGKVVSTTLGSHRLRADGQSVTIYQPARIIRQRLFVPLRAVGYALGVGVQWDGPTRTVQVRTGTRPGPIGPT